MPEKWSNKLWQKPLDLPSSLHYKPTLNRLTPHSLFMRMSLSRFVGSVAVRLTARTKECFWYWSSNMTESSPEHGPVILVVDDSLEMQRYMRLLLELDSYQVEVVGSGEDALELVRRGFIPSLVLLDLQLPGIDGLHTLRRLKKLRPSMPIILCSAEADEEKVQLALAHGAQAYLHKPVQQLYLSAAIQRSLGNVAEPARTQVSSNLITLPQQRAFI